MITETHISDVAPGTLPAWVLAAAHKDGEWLVLSDRELEGDDCCPNGVWDSGARYEISTLTAFLACGCCANGEGELCWCGDSLPEARAAFARLRDAWLEAPDE